MGDIAVAVRVKIYNARTSPPGASSFLLTSLHFPLPSPVGRITGILVPSPLGQVSEPAGRSVAARVSSSNCPRVLVVIRISGLFVPYCVRHDNKESWSGSWAISPLPTHSIRHNQPLLLTNLSRFGLILLLLDGALVKVIGERDACLIQCIQWYCIHDYLKDRNQCWSTIVVSVRYTLTCTSRNVQSTTTLIKFSMVHCLVLII